MSVDRAKTIYDEPALRVGITMLVLSLPGAERLRDGVTRLQADHVNGTLTRQMAAHARRLATNLNAQSTTIQFDETVGSRW